MFEVLPKDYVENIKVSTTNTENPAYVAVTEKSIMFSFI